MPETPFGRELKVGSWEEFEAQLRELRAASINASHPLLYRGQPDASWSLTTTLERATSGRYPVRKYYRLIRKIRPQIETFTESDWPLPEVKDIENALNEFDFGIELLKGNFLGYHYMMYLRHHGFPAPLLDWSRSPYVAAYFAFRQSVTSAREVAIYVFNEWPTDLKSRGSDKPTIYSLGQYVRSHKRHFLQQSMYTMCIIYDTRSVPKEWHFSRHDKVFEEGRPDQDLLAKIIIPSSQRMTFLRRLEEFNLSAFSLFGSEESLMETLAVRELDLS